MRSGSQALLPGGVVRPGGLRALQQRAQLVVAAQHPEQRRDAQLQVLEGDVGRLDAALEAREQVVGLREELAAHVAAGQEQPGVDPAAGGHGAACELRAELGVARPQRGSGGLDEQLDVDRRAGVEQPAGHAQCGVGRERPALLHRGGELQAVLAPAHQRQRRRARPRRRWDARRAPRRHRGRRIATTMRWASASPTACAPVRSTSSGNGSGSPSASSSTARRAGSSSPAMRASTRSTRVSLTAGRCFSRHSSAHLLQLPGLERAQQQLADEERVPAAALVRPAAGLLLERAADDRLGEGAGRVLVERRELEPQRARVLPQRHDRVLDRLAVADRGDDEGGAGHGQVQHDGGGHRVEQLRVVDAEHHGRARCRARAGRRRRGGSARAARRSATSAGSTSASAASGTDAALRVACTHATCAPSRSASATASRASPDLPTPAAAVMTTPGQPIATLAPRMRPSSSSRPTSGHAAARASREGVPAGCRDGGLTMRAPAGSVRSSATTTRQPTQYRRAAACSSALLMSGGPRSRMLDGARTPHRSGALHAPSRPPPRPRPHARQAVVVARSSSRR